MSSSKALGAVVLGGAIWLVLATLATAAIDLAGLHVAPQRGQSAEQARRDRYECHNWAVEQTGVVPLAAPPTNARDDERARRAERIDRVLSGAAIGAGIGGLIRSVQDKDPSHGVLAGAAVGAAVGAGTTRAAERSIEDDADNDYLRALSACLEGRGYSVSLPGEESREAVAAQ